MGPGHLIHISLTADTQNLITSRYPSVSGLGGSYPHPEILIQSLFLQSISWEDSY